MPAEERELADVLDATVDVDDPGAEQLLGTGSIDVLGRMPWSSNATFLVTVADGERRCQAVYKPERGERPLWDFPPGLWRREVAAYRVGVGLGWDLVPPTVPRDGPMGVGSLQFFVPSRFDEHYFTFKDEAALRPTLERLCLFDIVTNNTDRKAGHVLRSHSGRLWGIDHGLSFHEEFKLRTVIWDFAGDPVGATMATDVLTWVERDLLAELDGLLSAAEVEAMVDRAHRAVAAGCFPHDPTGRRYPWPLV